MARNKFKVLPKRLEGRAQAKEFLHEDNDLFIRDIENLKSILIKTSDISGHISNINNPHKVDKHQIGLSNVINMKQVTYQEFKKHTDNINNPHSLTKHSIGLSEVLDIEHATKEELDAVISEVRSTMDKLNNYFLSVVDKLNLEKHTATITTTPNDVKVEVYYDDKWNEGLSHNLYIGYYQYRLSKDGFETKVGNFKMDNKDTDVHLIFFNNLLQFNVTPEDAVVRVRYNDKWNTGKTHEMIPGIYEWEITKDEFVTRTGTVTIEDELTVVDITLEEIMYDLEILSKPYDAKVEVFYNDKWNEGASHSLPLGNYKYRVSKDHYNTMDSTIDLHENTSLTPTLNRTLYKLNVVTTPVGIVEVYYNDKWNIGDYHELPLGVYTVQVSKEGYKTKIVSVEIQEDTTTTIDLEYDYYSLLFRTTPQLATVEVYYNDKWNEGRSHLLKTGTYNYRVSYLGMETKESSIDLIENTSLEVILDFKPFNLTITPNPSDAIVEVYYNNQWNEGYTHQLIPGEYGYRINKTHYNTLTDIVHVVSEDVSITKDLTKKLYDLDFNINPINSIVLVDINGVQTPGTHFELETGEYNYNISKEGYGAISDKVVLIEDTVITKNLTSDKVEVVVTTNPSDATVEIRHSNGEWVEGHTQMLPYGNYDIKISKAGYNTLEQSIVVDFNNKTFSFIIVELSNSVTFTTTPEDSTVKIKFNESWLFGKTHKLPPGEYEYEIDHSSNNYTKSTGTFTMGSDNTSVTVELTPKLFTLTINTEPADATVEVYYNDQWNVGREHQVPFGTYQYKVSKGDEA